MAGAGARTRRVVMALIALCITACAASPEEQVLTRFFEASRALDSTLLSRLATVTFNPRTDGSIQQFSVTDRGTEQRSAFSGEQREEATRSLSAATGQSIDLRDAGVEMVTRQVTLQANVRTPEGAVAPTVLTVTLRRAIAKPQSGPAIEGRWIVTRLQRAPAARTSRAASSVPRS